MKARFPLFLILVLCLSALQLGMARNGQYDEEARAAERLERERGRSEHSERHPVRNFAGGVKQATVDSTTGLLQDTAESTRDEAPIIGTLEGARRGSGKVLDNAVKGVGKIATLGYGEVDSYVVQEPEKGTDEPTKIKIAF